jgi:hypothetical protein
MKTTGYFIIATIALAGCSNNDQLQKLTDQHKQDSVLLVQSTQKDSTISGYLGELNQIQENLDRIKAREKIITANSPENKQSMIAEVKELDEWIVANDKKMNTLLGRLKKLENKNANLQNLVTHDEQEISDMDAVVVTLQDKLSCADDSVKTITATFNDSIVVIKMVRAQVTEMTNEMNTVYYISGTMKQLKDKGIVDKEGGFLGIGRNAKVNPETDNSKYTQADLTNLKGISLDGKFKKFITAHPENSYTITSTTDNKADYVSITNPSAFWGESKYMVVALK